MRRPRGRCRPTLTFKIAYTAFVLLVAVIWWRHYSWRNFLWFSDIAFIGAVPALWLESSAIASVLAVAVLLPEFSGTSTSWRGC